MGKSIVIACDAFKGSLSAELVGEALSAGLTQQNPEIIPQVFPIADGGEGTLDALLRVGFQEVHTSAAGPTGVMRPTRFIFKEDTAVIELAEICGMLRLPGSKPAPLTASTFGFGQVIGEALARGFRKIILAIGGSASSDGGSGLAAALGAEIIYAQGRPVEATGRGIVRVQALNTARLQRAIADSEFVVVSDVKNPLLGASGAVATYAQQKGATERDKVLLEQGLGTWADTVELEFDLQGLRELPGAGAAGGAGFGAMAFLGARMESGVDFLLNLLGFEELLPGCDMVITGEGSLDGQTLDGKAVQGAAAVAKRHGVPAVAVCGVNTLAASQLNDLGITAVFALSDIEMDPERSRENAYELLVETGKLVGAYVTERSPGVPGKDWNKR